MFGLLKSTLGLVEDVVEITLAPTKIAVDTTRIVTKPIAEVAKEVADSIEDK